MLRANISHLAALKRHVRVDVSYLNHEWLNSVIVPIHYAFGENDGMISHKAQVSGPVLRGSYCRTVQHELVSLSVKSRGGLELGNVGSMSQFSLRVTTHHF